MYHQRRLLHTGRNSFGVYNSILDTIGKTPVIKLNNVAPKHVTMYAKCEFFNPLGSVKDRLALAVIEDAERRGVLKPGDTIIEATSGNTGIALAMVAAQKGYKCVLTMADSFSIERRRIMRALGAKVILTPASERGVGMVKKAQELAKANGYFQTRQFENEANSRYHGETTGPEILSTFGGKRLDYWVTGYGTGGTFSGAGRVLKAARPELKIILSEPSVAPLVSSGKEQKYQDDGSPDLTHEAFTPHPIQGWTPDFIPKLAKQGLDKNLADDCVTVSPEDAIATSRELASKEGVFVGVSAGATLHAAKQVATNAPDGSVFLVMLPDTGERYFTSPLWSNIEEGMNYEEKALSESTPGYHIV